jgi:hypothetical protein
LEGATFNAGSEVGVGIATLLPGKGTELNDVFAGGLLPTGDGKVEDTGGEFIAAFAPGPLVKGIGAASEGGGVRGDGCEFDGGMEKLLPVAAGKLVGAESSRGELGGLFGAPFVVACCPAAWTTSVSAEGSTGIGGSGEIGS